MTFQDEPNAGTPAPATPDFKADIPLDLAVRAHEGTSHSPERRGESEVSGYTQTLAADLAEFTALAEKYGSGDQLAELFPKYRDAYKRSTLAHLSAKSRCISSMITGGSNFPVRRAEKANATEHRRLEELLNCRKLWHKRILKAITPNTGGPIMSGDAAAYAAGQGRPPNDNWAASDDGRASYGYLLARHYGYREARLAYGGYDWGGSPVPLSTLIDQKTSTISRLSGGGLNPIPEVVLINLGENGAPALTDVTQALVKLRSHGHLAS